MRGAMRMRSHTARIATPPCQQARHREERSSVEYAAARVLVTVFLLPLVQLPNDPLQIFELLGSELGLLTEVGHEGGDGAAERLLDEVAYDAGHHVLPGLAGREAVNGAGLVARDVTLGAQTL